MLEQLIKSNHINIVITHNEHELRIVTVETH